MKFILLLAGVEAVTGAFLDARQSGCNYDNCYRALARHTASSDCATFLSSSTTLPPLESVVHTLHFNHNFMLTFISGLASSPKLLSQQPPLQSPPSRPSSPSSVPVSCTTSARNPPPSPNEKPFPPLSLSLLALLLQHPQSPPTPPPAPVPSALPAPAAAWATRRPSKPSPYLPLSYRPTSPSKKSTPPPRPSRCAIRQPSTGSSTRAATSPIPAP